MRCVPLALALLALACEQPQRIEPMAGRARAGAGLSDAELAAELARRHAALPDEARLLEPAARLLCSQDRHPECVDVTRRLLELEPGRCDIWRMRARAWLAIEDEHAAFEDLRACLRHDPDDVESLFSLGGLLAARHPDEASSLAEAISRWTRLVELAPRHPRAGMVGRALPGLRMKYQALVGEDGEAGSP
ncbi:MAG: hypothetical protein JXR96_14625 [Deltaproteobacteria bacterium]|nr:hypothetical protein [Deltaproteobacteria bacterium]